MTIRVILNPQARGGVGRRTRDEIRAELAACGARADIVDTRFAGHAVQLAREAVRDGAAIVVAAGGDGTVHDVANGILLETDAAPRDVALGIIPIGTGNDFAKMVPGAGSRAEAVRTLAAGASRPFDVGVATWGSEREYFLNAIGTGVDVEVVRQIQRLSRGTGALVYIEGLFRALARYRALPVSITVDGVTQQTRVLTVTVANGRCVGGLFRITPSAIADDGRLDLCIIGDMPLAAQLALVPGILRGTHGSSPRVQTGRVSQVVLRVPPEQPLYFQLDGELREPAGVTELRIDLLPARLRVVTRAGT